MAPKHKSDQKKLCSLPGTAAILIISGIFSCSDQEQTADDRISLLKLQTLPEVAHPANNPTSSAKVELGRLLFYDPVLSGQRDISCYTCHLPENAYAEPLDLSKGPGGVGVGLNRVGGRAVIRNSTGVVNSAYVGLRDANQILDVNKAPMTWTGIVYRGLEPQATSGALINPTHMRGSGQYDNNSVGDSLSIRLRKIVEYVELFNTAFGTPAPGESSVNRANIGFALGAFQRSLISKNSPYDRYVRGDRNALTEQQKQGLLLFYGKANCSSCHGGPMFSDWGIYNLGVKDHPNVAPKDKGANGKRLFRTPSIRNATLTAPYMHNGTITTLKDVIEFYNKGLSENDSVPQSEMSIKIKPLQLSHLEKDALLAFLEALTDDSFDKTIPTSVPSGLPVGGN